MPKPQLLIFLRGINKFPPKADYYGDDSLPHGRFSLQCQLNLFDCRLPMKRLTNFTIGRKEGTYLFDQTTIQYIFMKMQWSGDCR